MPDKDGKPLLSWRVLLLPYLEHDELFRQFHLDEPWDSPHNIALLGKMPKIYEPFRGRKDNPPYTTHYRVFVGKNTPFGERVKFTEIPNGTSNTIMVIEAGEPVPWTKPDELEYAPGRPLPDLGLTPDSVLAVMFDGSVLTFPKPLSEAEIRRMIRLKDE